MQLRAPFNCVRMESLAVFQLCHPSAHHRRDCGVHLFAAYAPQQRDLRVWCI